MRGHAERRVCVCVCVYLCVCLSVCVSVCVFVRLFVHISLPLSSALLAVHQHARLCAVANEELHDIEVPVACSGVQRRASGGACARVWVCVELKQQTHDVNAAAVHGRVQRDEALVVLQGDHK